MLVIEFLYPGIKSLLKKLQKNYKKPNAQEKISKQIKTDQICN